VVARAKTRETRIHVWHDEARRAPSAGESRVGTQARMCESCCRGGVEGDGRSLGGGVGIWANAKLYQRFSQCYPFQWDPGTDGALIGGQRDGDARTVG